MSSSDSSQEQELRIQRQVAFASGLFHGDITIHTLLESLAEGVVIIDNTGTILLVNNRADQMFGYSEKELVGRPHALLIPERFRKVHEEHMAHFFAEPKIRPMGLLLDLTGLRRDGSEFPLEISLSFIETINGILVMAFISDITLRKQHEAHLRETEELFRIQVEGVKDYAIFMIDTQGNVLNWNAGAERLKGYKGEEIIGKHFSCFYTDEDRNAGKPEKLLKKAGAEGRAMDEGWRIRKDGRRFWADVIITALYNERGYLRGFSKVTHDITARKKATDALRFSEARYRALFRDNPTMIVTLDADWKMLSVNPICASHLGYTIDELEGQSILILFQENDHPAVIEQLRKCLQNPQQVNRWQIRKLRKDGVLLWVEEIAQAMYGPNGTLIVQVVCQDVSERKQAEEEIERLNANVAARAAELEVANQELGAFNYTVAHDLRTPLNTLGLSCQAIEMLCGDQLNEECKGYIRNIYSSTLHMNQLIDALLTFAHMGHVEPHRGKADLSALAQEVITMLQMTEPERQVDFRIADGIEANGDANLLRIVLDNLLGNAWKYSVRQEKAIIEFGVTGDRRIPTYFVRDNGAGFDKADADKLFVPFQRLPGAEISKGFGIGLPTVERIIKRHGGRIWAEGEPGKGAAFFFTLAAE